jgi:hypothetical protein
MRKPTKTSAQLKRLQAKRTQRTLRSREKATNYTIRRQTLLVPALRRKREEEQKERVLAAAKAQSSQEET